MASIGVLSARDLQQRSGELFKDAEEGRLVLIKKHGRPSILAAPFDERLLDLGVHRALALHLFERSHATLAQAAEVAGVTPEEFVGLLGRTGIPAVDYPPEELDEELGVAS